MVAEHTFYDCAILCSLDPDLGGAAASAQDRGKILVLDGSGSIGAELPEGRSRSGVARDVLANFLSARDPAQPLGVITHGHNRRGDCSDIETIAPVALHEGQALGQRLHALMPPGKTPLADALRRAASKIPATAEEADIVPVTDGLEACGGDPCSVAAELAAERIQIRADIAVRPDKVAFRADHEATGEARELGVIDFTTASVLGAELAEGNGLISPDAGDRGKGEIVVAIVTGEHTTIFVPFRGHLPTLDMTAPTGAFRAGVDSLMSYRILAEELATGGDDFIFSVLPIDASDAYDAGSTIRRKTAVREAMWAFSGCR